MRSPLFLSLVLLAACTAHGASTVGTGSASDAAPSLSATTTCTQATMATPGCEDLRKGVENVDAPNPAIARALEWLDDGVTGSRAHLHRGYRADSTGMLAMAWAESVDMADGNEPPAIPRATTLSSPHDLAPGDALESHGHALLFGGWANAERTSAIVLTQPEVGQAAMHAVPRSALEAWTPVRRAD